MKIQRTFAFLLMSVIGISANAAPSPAATQSWVTNYVGKTVGTDVARTSTDTNGVFTVRVGKYTMWMEPPTVWATMATNATDAAVAEGVTNGMYFVWNGGINGFTNHNDTIYTVGTNFVWHGMTGSGFSITNYFDIVVKKIQPTYAKEVTK